MDVASPGRARWLLLMNDIPRCQSSRTVMSENDGKFLSDNVSHIWLGACQGAVRALVLRALIAVALEG